MNKKQFLYNSITVALLLVSIAFLYFLYFINTDRAMKIVGTMVIFFLFVLWCYFERNINQNNIMCPSNVKCFVLIAQNGEMEKEWHCEGVRSFLIGKGNILSDGDIDLSDSYYTDYISPAHAVLNYSQGYWYIEDLNSKNGVGIKKRGEEYALRLKPMTSYKIEQGDIIYISKAKLLVR